MDESAVQNSDAPSLPPPPSRLLDDAATSDIDIERLKRINEYYLAQLSLPKDGLVTDECLRNRITAPRAAEELRDFDQWMQNEHDLFACI